MRGRVTKAIFPVAGLGTRFLPATKSIPKEILTLVDRPLIQYAIDEARASGITEFIFVTSRGKSALEDYFDEAPELVAALKAKNKTGLLETLRETDMPSGAIAYIRQNQPLGLGHAIWCARHLIGDEPFAVILPDDVIAAERPCLAQLLDAQARSGGSVVAAMEVAPEAAASYGVLDVGFQRGRVVRAVDLVEKPKPGTAPSNLAVIGRYVLTQGIMQRLGSVTCGAGGEVQLTDALAAATREGEQVHGYLFDGRRFDCGSKAGFLQATVAFALSRPDLREEFSAFLREVA
jgi:UTP--glucose-1-phosphate uridylyltransferase